jgi:hypothetical protein
MPYCAQTFAIIKNTEKYRNQMCALNRKSYHKLKTERKDDYMNKLVSKQAKLFIKKNNEDIEIALSRVLASQGETRYTSLRNKLKELGYERADFPVGEVS